MRLAPFLPYFVALGALLSPRLADAQAGPGRAAVSPAQESADAARDAARPIAAGGLDHYDAGRYPEAIEHFQRADALFPTPHYRVYLARANGKLGRLLAAASAYAGAAGMPLPEDAAPSFLEAQATARVEAAELQERIPIVDVVVVGPAPGDVRIVVDGASVDPANQRHISVDPGAHTIVASAPGFETSTRAVQLAEASVIRLDFALSQVTSANPPSPPVFQGQGTPQKERDRPSIPDAEGGSDRSHEGQIGAMLRGDVDPLNGGVLLAVGGSFGILDRLDVGAAALLGRDKGGRALRHTVRAHGGVETVSPSWRANLLRGRRAGRRARIGGAPMGSKPARGPLCPDRRGVLRERSARV